MAEMIRWVPVTEILKKVKTTADAYNPGSGEREWFRLMYSKLGDRQTPAIIRAIESKGFIDPICIEEMSENDWELGNGHHRLAIAILLGLDQILVDFSSWYSDSSDEHGSDITDDRQDDDYELAQWISNQVYAGQAY